jgi:hypothetical protein
MAGLDVGGLPVVMSNELTQTLEADRRIAEQLKTILFGADAATKFYGPTKGPAGLDSMMLPSATA